jgi:hypothetical protein
VGIVTGMTVSAQTYHRFSQSSDLTKLADPRYNQLQTWSQPIMSTQHPPIEGTSPTSISPSVLATAQKLSEQLTISSGDWHRLKGNRQARALEQAAAALVFLLKDQPEEGLMRLQQAVGWLDRSISAPPCPTHGYGSATAKTSGQSS